MGIRIFIAAMLVAGPALADANMRPLVVRERNTASLLDGAFTFQVWKIRGYSIDVKIGGTKRKLKLRQSFGPADGQCRVVFEEISPETRIARFRTDCPADAGT